MAAVAEKTTAEPIIRGASLGQILDRLASAPEYHPLEAETFADWSMEAGDIVTVSRDGRDYYSPVHESTVSWRKQQQITLSSKGNQERKSISKLSQQRYNRAGGGSRRQDYWAMVVSDETGRLQSGIELTYSSARMWVTNLNEEMHSELELTASTARLWVDQSYHMLHSELELTRSTARLWVTNVYEGLHSEIMLTASSARMWVNDLDAKTRGELEITASTAKLWVEDSENRMKAGLDITLSSAKLYAFNRTTKASIIARINEDGESEALIEADRVSISGRTTIGDCMTISEGGLYIKKSVRCPNNMLVESLTVRGSHGDGTISGDNIEDIIAKASVSGNVLTLTTIKGREINFSKATTLSGTWSGGTLTVKASPQNVQKTFSIFDATGSDVSWSGNQASIKVYANMDGGETKYNTGKVLKISALSRYNAGWDDALKTRSTSGRAATGSEQAIKYLDYGDKWTVVFSINNSSGVAQESKYTLQAPNSNAPKLQSKSTNVNGTVTADSGYDGLSSVEVNVPGEQHPYHITFSDRTMEHEVVGGQDIYHWHYNITTNSGSAPTGGAMTFYYS